MPATLNINIISTLQPGKEEIKFYEGDELSVDAEKQLLNKIQEVFAVARKLNSSCEICITIETPYINEASFLIKKKNQSQPDVNQQKLSIREIEVLGLIMNGLTNNEIAEKLFISYETVKSHRKNILEKTGSKNTAALINHYHQTFFDK